ncbi:unnamed protein product [Ectocarpus sp. 8 AP-2014]
MDPVKSFFTRSVVGAKQGFFLNRERICTYCRCWLYGKCVLPAVSRYSSTWTCRLSFLVL